MLKRNIVSLYGTWHFKGHTVSFLLQTQNLELLFTA